MFGVEWIELAKERDKWWAVVNGVVIFRIFIECGAFEWLRNSQFLNKDSSTWRQFVNFIPVCWSLRLPRYLENVQNGPRKSRPPSVLHVSL